MEELNININIDLKDKSIYIAEECSSGAEYKYKNIEELKEKISFYIDNYYRDVIENVEENEL